MSNLTRPLIKVNNSGSELHYNCFLFMNIFYTLGPAGIQKFSILLKEKLNNFLVHTAVIKYRFYKCFISDENFWLQMEKELLRADEADLVPEVFLKQKTEKSLNKYHLLFSLWNTMPLLLSKRRMRLSHWRNAKCMYMELRGRMMS